MNESALSNLVYGVVQLRPAGMKHAEVVREVRRRGYASPDLSAAVHAILTEFVTTGVILRNQNDLMERRYHPVPIKNRVRILVVDDDVDNADSSASLLEYAGHEVRTAYSGPDALQAVGEWHPNIVLLDIQMPEMNGYDTARSLRRTLDPLTLVAVTGLGDRMASKEAGFDYHLTKPVEDEQLLEMVEAGTYPYEEAHKGRFKTLKEEFA